jgi:hypothetical protein
MTAEDDVGVLPDWITDWEGLLWVDVKRNSRQTAAVKVPSNIIHFHHGPSLRHVDLQKLDRVATIGMNAAYRYWERIDWYPTYYCCLDEIVVESHASAISTLLNDSPIRNFFLNARFLEIFPQYREDSRILDLDRVSQAWFQKQGRVAGKPFIHHAAFSSCYPALITTGAWATRWSAFLGYRYAYLFGIDMAYVDKLPGVVVTESGRLRMASNPRRNPNHFFDEYQLDGDEFQEPNPLTFNPNLHRDSFAALRHDFVQQRVGCEVFCAQPDSGVARSQLFPIRSMQWLDTEPGAVQ